MRRCLKVKLVNTGIYRENGIGITRMMIKSWVLFTIPTENFSKKISWAVFNRRIRQVELEVLVWAKIQLKIRKYTGFSEYYN